VPSLDAFATLAEGLDHPEGIAAGPDGTLHAGGEAGQIYWLGEGGSIAELASTGGFIYGVTLDARGNVFACDFGNASVMRISSGGEVSTYSTGTPERPMRVPNFSAFDEAGNLYVTDSGEWGDDDGVVYRISPGGATEIWTEATHRVPERLLPHRRRGRAPRDRVARSSGGPCADPERRQRRPPEPVVDLSGSQPDGIALAEDGTMFVGCYRPDRVYRIPPGGSTEVFAEDPDGVVLNQPANVAFWGPDLDRLVVSSLGGWSLVAAPVGVRGLPLRYPSV
jgi:gluconolactonase